MRVKREMNLLKLKIYRMVCFLLLFYFEQYRFEYPYIVPPISGIKDQI